MHQRMIASMLTLALVVMIPAMAQPQDAPARMSVKQLGVGTGVGEDRNLVGESDSFPVDTRVWFWTRVLGGGEEGDYVRHVWFHDGEEVLNFGGLRVGSPSWRTWTNKILGPGSEGEWRVEVRDPQDRVLASKTFRCVSAP